MADMSPTELKHWKSRLEDSHRLWKQHGMTGDSVQSTRSPFRYVEAYRGNQWSGMSSWAGIQSRDLLTVNMVFANTNQQIGRLSKRNPEPVVTSRKNDLEGQRKARIRQLLLSYYIYELRMKRQVDRSLRDALVSPFGFILHGYTPAAEKYQIRNGQRVEVDLYAYARSDAPYIRRAPFWDMRIDADADSFYPDDDARWFAHRDLIPKRHFLHHPALINRKDLRATVSSERRSIEEMKRAQVKDFGEDWDDLVEVWWVWDKEERKRFALSEGSESEVSAAVDWPLPYEDLPYSVLMFNEQMDSNVPVAYPSAYSDQQVELNKVRTLMSDLIKHTRRATIFNRMTLSEDDRKRFEAGNLELHPVIAVDGDLQNSVANVPIGGFDQALLLYENTIKNDIREAIGLSNMDRGQRINVETANESANVQQGADTIAGRNEDAFEGFWTDILRTFCQGLDHVLKENPAVALPIVGEADAKLLGDLVKDGTLYVDDEMIQGEFDYKVRARSTLPEDRDREFAKIMSLKQVFMNDPTVNLRELNSMALELANFDSSRFVLTQDEVIATTDNLRDEGVLGAKPEGRGGTVLDANTMRALTGGRA